MTDNTETIDVAGFDNSTFTQPGLTLVCGPLQSRLSSFCARMAPCMVLGASLKAKETIYNVPKLFCHDKITSEIIEIITLRQVKFSRKKSKDDYFMVIVMELSSVDDFTPEFKKFCSDIRHLNIRLFVVVELLDCELFEVEVIKWQRNLFSLIFQADQTLLFPYIYHLWFSWFMKRAHIDAEDVQKIIHGVLDHGPIVLKLDSEAILPIQHLSEYSSPVHSTQYVSTTSKMGAYAQFCSR